MAGIIPGCDGGAALKTDEALRRWLETAATRAIDPYQLPGWKNAALSAERVQKLRPPGVRQAQHCDFAALLDYPENGLLPHPVTEPARVIPMLRAGFAA